LKLATSQLCADQSFQRSYHIASSVAKEMPMRPNNSKFKEWKAHLNINRSQIKNGVHYWGTYVLVASLHAICLLLTLTARHPTQLDFVLVVPHAPIEREETYT
jgi:hypothetical protein